MSIVTRDEKSQLLVGVRRANSHRISLPSSVLSANNMPIDAFVVAANRTLLPVVYYPGNMGTIVGISDLDPLMWPDSRWKTSRLSGTSQIVGENPIKFVLGTFFYPPGLRHQVLKGRYNLDCLSKKCQDSSVVEMKGGSTLKMAEALLFNDPVDGSLEDRCLIFQLAHAATIPDCLRVFMKDRRIGFPGFKNLNYSQDLKWSKHALEMFINPADLTLWRQPLLNYSVDDIVKIILGFRVQLKEDVRMSDWSVERLSDEQVVYASVKTHCAFRIGREFKVWRWG